MVNVWWGQNSHEVDQGCSHCGLGMVKLVGCTKSLNVHLPNKCDGIMWQLLAKGVIRILDSLFSLL